MAQVTLESLAAQLAEQAKVIEKQNQTIGELQAKRLESIVKEVKPPSIPKKAVEVNGKKYQFTVATFCFPGSDKKYLSEEVATDKVLLVELIKIEGQGILRELV